MNGSKNVQQRTVNGEPRTVNREINRLQPKKSEYEYELEDKYDFGTKATDRACRTSNAKHRTLNAERFLFDSCQTLPYIQ